MSMPNIPDISPQIDLSREDIVTLLLASVALEEISLGHVMNAEAEKLQALIAQWKASGAACPEQLLAANDSVERTVSSLNRMQMMLGAKLENILRLTSTATSTCTATVTHTCPPPTHTHTHTHTSPPTTATTATVTHTCPPPTHTHTSTCPPIHPCRPGETPMLLAGEGTACFETANDGGSYGEAALALHARLAPPAGCEDALVFSLRETRACGLFVLKLRAETGEFDARLRCEGDIILEGEGLLRGMGYENASCVSRAPFLLVFGRTRQGWYAKIRLRLPDGCTYHGGPFHFPADAFSLFCR